MHPYATDSNERLYIVLALIPISYWVSSWIVGLFEARNMRWPEEAEFIADPTSAVFTLYALLWFFDNLLWRLPLFRWLHIVSIPNLNGRWSGILQSSFHEFKVETPIELTIEQTWFNMVVRLRTDQSRSYSRTGSLIVKAGTGTTLYYTYSNEPGATQDRSMETHQGTAVLVLDRSRKPYRLEGEYYSGRGRGRYGSMAVSRD